MEEIETRKSLPGDRKMQKPQKVREVYAELKLAFGDEMSARELLECASQIVNASEDTLYDPNVEYRRGRVPFAELPVNLVMENWSWKVLNREMVWEDDFMPQVPKQVLIEQCLACN
jgi:hypothetical protein